MLINKGRGLRNGEEGEMEGRQKKTWAEVEGWEESGREWEKGTRQNKNLMRP